MSRITKLLSFVSPLVFATLAHASEGEGVAPAAAKLVDFGNGWAITNSMATGWAVSALIIGLILFAVRKPQVLRL
jgi:F-type H+-transporting ATPase subunit a